MKKKKQGGNIKKENQVKKIPVRKASKKRKFEFTKMVASGNDFIIFDNRRAGLKNGPEIARLLCVRTNGVGADGLIFIESSKRADFKMRIFNPDGSEAEMCGNGIRCAVLYKGKKNTKVETLAGLLSAELKDYGIKVRMTDPKGLQLNVNLDIDGRIYQVNYVNTGVPHSVYFVENLEATNVRMLGRLIRYHRDFEPVGTNVDFAKIIDQDTLQIRTYERGVEEETLACGTGSVASALVYHHKFVGTNGTYMVNIHTKGSEVLKIYFDYKDGSFSNVWLEGRASMVYKGECYV
ncbi:MAG: diaminopimelate epimerase [Candidatus Omnitrophica bacterium]|nr:diaminopimelate epimerase [Candidatus Omnitrophota bacterium]MBU4479122.1 diaminopimelate epimerase [Candidatus Omnitrophota bacterium]MCG2703393.1 diaminopimelate epimerase [Candidatus Omnitrophota bacterium]